jgi:hypothetical protein
MNGHKKKKAYAFFSVALLRTARGRCFPKEPLKIFPRFVFLSPLPIKNNLRLRIYSICGRKSAFYSIAFSYEGIIPSSLPTLVNAAIARSRSSRSCAALI